MQGEQKTWFTLTDATTVSRYYLLALLKCPAEEVPHAAKDDEYRVLLGMVPETLSLGRLRGKRKHLHLEDDWPCPQDRRPVAKARPRHIASLWKLPLQFWARRQIQ